MRHRGVYAQSGPEFAEAHLAAAFDDSNLPGGQFALRHIVEAQGHA